MLWRELVAANPFLKEPGRVYEKGDKTIVVIRPGEAIEGLTNLGLEAEVLPIDQLMLKETEAPATTAQIVPTITGVNWPVIIAVLIVLGLILVLYFLMNEEERRRSDSQKTREQKLRHDPVTSGPPIVAGGVQPNETERLSRTLETAAVSDYVRLNPNVSRETVRVERIGPVEEGLIAGSGMVGYADCARARTIDPPLPGYRARFRFPDGREDVLMSLQGCMNPVYFGEGMSGFTFTSRQEVVPAPEPVAPAPQPVPHPTMTIARIRATSEAEGASTIVVGGKIVTIERGAHFDLDSTPGSVKVTGGSFEATFRLKARSASKRNKPVVPKMGTTAQ